MRAQAVALVTLLRFELARALAGSLAGVVSLAGIVILVPAVVLFAAAELLGVRDPSPGASLRPGSLDRGLVSMLLLAAAFSAAGRLEDDPSVHGWYRARPVSGLVSVLVRALTVAFATLAVGVLLYAGTLLAGVPIAFPRPSLLCIPAWLAATSLLQRRVRRWLAVVVAALAILWLIAVQRGWDPSEAGGALVAPGWILAVGLLLGAARSVPRLADERVVAPEVVWRVTMGAVGAALAAVPLLLDPGRIGASHVVTRLDLGGAQLELLRTRPLDASRLAVRLRSMRGFRMLPVASALTCCVMHHRRAGRAIYPGTDPQTWHVVDRQTERTVTLDVVQTDPGLEPPRIVPVGWSPAGERFFWRAVQISGRSRAGFVLDRTGDVRSVPLPFAPTTIAWVDDRHLILAIAEEAPPFWMIIDTRGASGQMSREPIGELVREPIRGRVARVRYQGDGTEVSLFDPERLAFEPRPELFMRGEVEGSPTGFGESADGTLLWLRRRESDVEDLVWTVKAQPPDNGSRDSCSFRLRRDLPQLEYVGIVRGWAVWKAGSVELQLRARRDPVSLPSWLARLLEGMLHGDRRSALIACRLADATPRTIELESSDYHFVGIEGGALSAAGRPIALPGPASAGHADARRAGRLGASAEARAASPLSASAPPARSRARP